MKKTIAILMMIILPLGGSLLAQASQGELFLDLLVKDQKGRPFANAEVEFVEMQSRQRIVETTDAEGRVSYHFTTGRYWQINIKDIRNYFFWQFEVKPQKTRRQRRTITYWYERYERETRPPVDRVKLGLQTEKQNFSVTEKATKEDGIIKLVISKADDAPLQNYPVQLTCYALKKTFSGKTNPAGIATFKVPKGQEYEIDIDGIESFNYVDLPDSPYYTATKKFVYEPTEIQEKMVNDTITQVLDPDQEGTSGRVIASVKLKGGPDGFWRNEPVYFDEFNSNKVYMAMTDQMGEVRMLLPKGKRYMIHGKYERDLDVLDFRRRRGIGYANKTVLYRPLEQLQYPERYIPTPEALILRSFQDFIDKQYPGPSDDLTIRNNSEWGNKINAQSREAVLKLAFTARERKGLDNTPPLNLSFVLDKSGSMAGHDRMDQLKESMYGFIEQLRPDDRVSLVTFEDFETVVIPTQKIGSEKEKLNHSIYMIEAGGGTNIYKGLMEGYKQVEKHMNPKSTNRVILLTDGYGVTPPADILKDQKPYTDRGIQCSAVGVGEFYNAALLKLLATGGLIEHVGDASQMKKVFLEELSSVLYPVAQNVTVTVEFPSRLKYKQLYGFPLKEKGGNRLKMKLKNFYSGLTQLGLLQFELENPDPSLEKEPVKVKMQYRDLTQNKTVTTETEIPLVWTDAKGEIALMADQNDKKLLAVATLNQVLKVMSEAFAAGDRGKAKTALQRGLQDLEEIYPDAADQDVIALREKVQGYLDILSNLK